MNNEMTRRWFIGGAASFGAMASNGVLARAAEKMDEPILRLGIVSDTHYAYGWMERCFKKFYERGVDAIVHGGDLTEDGTLDELKKVRGAWDRVFPKGTCVDGRPLEMLFIRGNHEDFPNKKKPESAIQSAPFKSMQEILGETWYSEKIMLRKVKGYTFVLVDWRTTEQQMDEFFEKHGKELPTDKPFFFVQHAHPAGTVNKDPGEIKWASYGDLGNSTKWLKQYPNCYAFSGHSHFPITLGWQVWQEEFTSIGLGSVNYCENAPGRDNSWRILEGQTSHSGQLSMGGREYLYLNIYADRMVLERWGWTGHDIHPHKKIADDLVFPLDGTKPHSWAEQRKRARAPEFPAGAALAIEEGEGKRRPGKVDEHQVQIVIPRAAPVSTDVGRVYEYECRAFVENAAEPLIVRRLIAGGSYLGDEEVPKTSRLCFGVDELPKDKKLRFEVRAMDCWQNRSKRPLTAEYTLKG